MDLVIKVADFGLSVNTGNKDYYRITSDMGIKLPLKWMAPECLTDYIFSEMSDVVSIGEKINCDCVIHYSCYHMHAVGVWSHVLGGV